MQRWHRVDVKDAVKIIADMYGFIFLDEPVQVKPRPETTEEWQKRTDKELKEAREKQIPKKLYLTLRGTTGYNTEEHCPVCKTRVYDSYCSGCGQVIDWSEGE